MRASAKRVVSGIGGWPLEVVLWLLGGWGWAAFLRFGRLPLWFADWRERAFYAGALQRVLRGEGGSLSLAASLHGTTRWLAVPLVPFTPDVLVLRWLDVGSYLLVAALLAYSLGCLGLGLLRRRYALPWPAFLPLWLAFNGNGFLAPKLAVGQLVWWTGWFALPWVLLGVFEWVERGPGVRASLTIAFALAVAAMAGAFHFVTWCALFVILLSVSRTGWLKWGAFTLAAIAGLTAFRWLPGRIAFPTMSFGTANGFPSVAMMLESLAVPGGPNHPTVNGGGWWEFDAFTGGSGCLWLLAFGILPVISKSGFEAPGVPKPLVHRPLLVPLIGLAVLSWGQTWWWLLDRVPPFSGERVTSRLLAVPVAATAVLAAIRTGAVIRSRPRSRWIPVSLFALSAVLGFELLSHAASWNLAETLAVWGPGSRQTWPAPVFTDVPDPAYRVSLLAGWIVSLGSLAAALIMMHPFARRRR